MFVHEIKEMIDGREHTFRAVYDYTHLYTFLILKHGVTVTIFGHAALFLTAGRFAVLQQDDTWLTWEDISTVQLVAANKC